jgi:hypothetical protein
MDWTLVVMWVGFILAAYSVVGNDVIQTLGTFLTSNEGKVKWYVLWAFAAGIMALTLIYGWVQYDGDVSYARLSKYPDPREIEGFSWVYILPPLVLMVITRIGVPVSTSFLILTFFSFKNLNDMVIKSVSGYLVAFVAAVLLYLFITKKLEQRFIDNEIKDEQRKWWTVAQWASTGFLWTQWLVQDFANIYVYLPRSLEFSHLIISLVILLSLLGYIFHSKGGAIQGIVRAKTNTADIRSATFVDLSYGIILFFFKELNNVPMSTTWVFLGLLAGREIALRYNLLKTVPKATLVDVARDLGKVFLGLVISIGLVYIIQWLK